MAVVHCCRRTFDDVDCDFINRIVCALLDLHDGRRLRWEHRRNHEDQRRGRQDPLANSHLSPLLDKEPKLIGRCTIRSSRLRSFAGTVSLTLVLHILGKKWSLNWDGRQETRGIPPCTLLMVCGRWCVNRWDRFGMKS